MVYINKPTLDIKHIIKLIDFFKTITDNVHFNNIYWTQEHMKVYILNSFKTYSILLIINVTSVNKLLWTQNSENSIQRIITRDHDWV